MILRDFNKAFDFFSDLIKSDTNFAYARYADGEVSLMKGIEVTEGSQAYNIDRWKAPNELTKVGKDLLETLMHTEDNYYYAISSDTDFSRDKEFLTTYIKNKNNVTFANLWINANYQKMKIFYQTLNKPVYLICNEKVNRQNLPFKVNEIFPFPDDCINYWEKYGDDYISELINYIIHIKNKTFFISCGPISEILIHNLYDANPDNQYIDVGSSIDEFVHGYQTRPYMNPTSQYAKEISYFNKNCIF